MAHLLYLFEIVTTLVEITFKCNVIALGKGSHVHKHSSESNSYQGHQVTWETVQMDEKLFKNEQGVSAEQRHESKNNVQLHQLPAYLWFQIFLYTVYFEIYSTSSENVASNQNFKLSFCIPNKLCIRNGIFRWEKDERRRH